MKKLTELVDEVMTEHRGAYMILEEIVSAVNYKIEQWPLWKYWLWRLFYGWR